MAAADKDAIEEMGEGEWVKAGGPEDVDNREDTGLDALLGVNDIVVSD